MTTRRRLLTAGLLLGAVHAVASAGPLVVPASVPAGERARLETLASTADVTGRVAAEPFVIRKDVFEFLLGRPAFATAVARALELSRMRIEVTDAGLTLDDGDGLTGRFWLVHAAEGVWVARSRGAYRHPGLPAIHGEAVTIIEYTAAPRPDGKSLIRSTMSGLVRLDSRMLALALRPVAGVAERKANRTAHRLVRKFAKVSRALDADPRAVHERVRRQPDVSAPHLEEFGRILGLD
jgi:hypothetical protein